MLTIVVPASEVYNELTNEFSYTNETTIRLEHSLVSISKWEAKWKIPFLGRGEMTHEQLMDYVKYMTISQNVPEEVYRFLTKSNYDEIGEYIKDPMTATWFSDTSNKSSGREIITSERIYYWMVAYNIPFECQKWHLNRLLTLVKICSIENSKDSNKMSKSAIMRQNSALNKARRSKYKSKG